MDAEPETFRQDVDQYLSDLLDATENPTDRFYVLYSGKQYVTAIVGNGPTSEANTVFLSQFSPKNVLALLDTLGHCMDQLDLINAAVEEGAAE